METQAHMDIARSPGVSAVGNPRDAIYPSYLVVGEAPDPSYIVLKGPDGRYHELFISTGAVAARPTAVPYGSHGRSPVIGSFGKTVNSCIWVRGSGATRAAFVDAGVMKSFGVSLAGAIGAPVALTFEARDYGINIMGGGIEGTGRLVIESALGTPSGLVLQSTDAVPWVIWVDVSGALRPTSWSVFLAGV